MRRRTPDTWCQVNLRIKEGLRVQLAAAAKEHEVSFNEEVRARLMDSFEQKTRQSLADFLQEFDHNARSLIERNARAFARSADDLELIFRRLGALSASMKRTPASVEETLGPNIRDPGVQELLWGTPDETKSKTKGDKT